jgi:hypothetical protein
MNSKEGDCVGNKYIANKFDDEVVYSGIVIV